MKRLGRCAALLLTLVCVAGCTRNAVNPEDTPDESDDPAVVTPSVGTTDPATDPANTPATDPSAPTGTAETQPPADTPTTGDPSTPDPSTPDPTAGDQTGSTPTVTDPAPADPTPAEGEPEFPAPAEDGKVHVTQIQLDKYAVTVEVGKKDMPWVTMYPTTAENKAEIWTSDNTEIATVDKYGNITGVAEGTCRVTVRSADNRNVKAVVDVTVIPREPIHVTGISLDKYSVSLTVGLSDIPWVTMEPANADDKGEIWTSDNNAIATVNHYGLITGVGVGTCRVTVQSKDNPDVKATVDVTVAQKNRVTQTTVIEGILVVNKTYGLPETYNPGVNADAQAALDAMFAAAAEDGIELVVRSGFRSYELQTTIYASYVSRDGQAAADRYSARPGYSEHQTGLAFDLNSFEQSFGETPEGKWLAEHSWEYGFVIRYPADKEEITGFMYEPWHVRYFGKDVAKILHENDQTLEEYLGITSAYAQP